MEEKNEYSAAIDELRKQLAEAGEPPHPIDRWIYTLAALHHFIKKLQLGDAGGNWPIVSLTETLVELKNGKKPNLLVPRKRQGQTGRPPTSRSEWMLRVFSAVLMDSYMAAGLSRSEAAGRTVRKLRIGVSKEKIMRWRDSLTGPLPSDPDHRDAAMAFKNLMEECKGKSLGKLDIFAIRFRDENFIKESTWAPPET